jgi:periplasmic protein TonB
LRCPGSVAPFPAGEPRIGLVHLYVGDHRLAQVPDPRNALAALIAEKLFNLTGERTMSAALTINTFPAIHTFNSSRSWAMAIIVLLHFGFLWLLTSGMTVRLDTILTQPGKITLVEKKIEKIPPPPPIPYVVPTHNVPIPIPMPMFPPTGSEERMIHEDPQPPTQPLQPEPARHVPVMVDPQVDPRLGLSEPEYPPSAIREGREGTVLLSIQVLENGRVGEVRIERSSGVQSLDNSAVREARRWRFRPGTRDGAPVAMWKQLPVTFQLQK